MRLGTTGRTFVSCGVTRGVVLASLCLEADTNFSSFGIEQSLVVTGASSLYVGASKVLGVASVVVVVCSTKADCAE